VFHNIVLSWLLEIVLDLTLRLLQFVQLCQQRNDARVVRVVPYIQKRCPLYTPPTFPPRNQLRGGYQILVFFLQSIIVPDLQDKIDPKSILPASPKASTQQSEHFALITLPRLARPSSLLHPPHLHPQPQHQPAHTAQVLVHPQHVLASQGAQNGGILLVHLHL
jgi:hypothetical protein